jgi:hypothetical protein
MSTKNSLAYELYRFHFYTDCCDLDDQFVYLRQDKPEFEADQYGIMVAIPADVMDKMAEEWLKYRGK